MAVGVSTLAVEWIEIMNPETEESQDVVSTLAVEWIEIGNAGGADRHQWSPPSRWSGLKSSSILVSPARCPSPPSRWSGLKSLVLTSQLRVVMVSTLAVEWIEIANNKVSV